MKSQYISIFLLLIFTLFIYYISNIRNYYSYISEIDKYLAEDFKIKLVSNNREIVNLTYYNLCLEYKRYCYYNGSHVIVINGNRITTLQIES